MKEVYELKHPLVQHHLVRLRDKQTSPESFRRNVSRLSKLLTYEATSDLELESCTVETPMASMQANCLKHRIGLVPILRAGLGMVDPILDLIPTAEVWHLGFYRDETTFKPIEYYKKLPPAQPVDLAIVVDPMLATGGSAIAALKAIAEWGAPRLKLVSMIAAPEGIKKVHAEFPQAQIYVAAIDDGLNENAYIIPGLGDAGDRIFNAQAE